MLSDYFCQKARVVLAGSSYLRFQLSWMAVDRGCDDDPWRFSALLSAFLELFLSILLFSGAAIAWVTSQFVKHFGLEPPCSYIGCTVPHRPPFQQHALSHACDANGFATGSLCRDGPFFRSNSKLGLRNYCVTDENVDATLFATSRAYPRTSDFTRQGESGRRESGAAAGDPNAMSDFSELKTRDRHSLERSQHQIWCDLDNENMICSNCSAPLVDRVHRRRFIKRRMSRMSENGPHKFFREVDYRSLAKSIEARSEVAGPENFRKVNKKDSETEVDTETSSSSYSLKDVDGKLPCSLPSGGCASATDALRVATEGTSFNLDTHGSFFKSLIYESSSEACAEISEAPSSEVHSWATGDTFQDLSSHLQDGPQAQPQNHGEGRRHASEGSCHHVFEKEAGDLSTENPSPASLPGRHEEFGGNIDLSASPLDAFQLENSVYKLGEKTGVVLCERSSLQGDIIPNIVGIIGDETLWASPHPGTTMEEVGTRASLAEEMSTEGFVAMVALELPSKAIEEEESRKDVEILDSWQVDQTEESLQKAVIADLLRIVNKVGTLEEVGIELASADNLESLQQGGNAREFWGKKAGKDLSEEAQKHKEGYVLVEDLCEKSSQEQRDKGLFGEETDGAQLETSKGETVRDEPEVIREVASESESGDSHHVGRNKDSGRMIPLEEEQLEEMRSVQDGANEWIGSFSEVAEQQERGILAGKFSRMDQQKVVLEEIGGDAGYIDGALQDAQLEGSSTRAVGHPGPGHLKDTEETAAGNEVFFKEPQQRENSVEAQRLLSVQGHHAPDKKLEGCMGISSGDHNNKDYVEDCEEENGWGELKDATSSLGHREQVQHKNERVGIGKQMPNFAESSGDVGMKTSNGDVSEDGQTKKREEVSEEVERELLINGEVEDCFWCLQEEIKSQDGVGEALTADGNNVVSDLYAELEEERKAAAIAANEAMAMISRLQEEKAAMQMEAAQYQRMAEEKAVYDEQAMQLLKEILYKREKEIFALEKEVELYRERFLRKKVEDERERTRIERRRDALSIMCREPLLLLGGAGEQISESDSLSAGLQQCFPQKNLTGVGQKPSKRLKTLPSADEDRFFHGKSRVYRSFSGGPLDEAIRKHYIEGEMHGFRRLRSQPGNTQHMENWGRSMFLTDNEVTRFILERVWALEEQLREVGEREGLLHSRNVDLDFEAEEEEIEKRTVSRENLCGEGKVGKPFAVITTTSGTTRDDPAAAAASTMTEIAPPPRVSSEDDDTWNQHGMKEWQQHREEASIGRSLPVQLGPRKQPAGKQRLDDMGDGLGKPDDFGVGGHERLRGRRLFSPQDYDHFNNYHVWRDGAPSHYLRTESMVLRDTMRMQLEKEVGQVTKRLQLLEANRRELVSQTLESLKHKDTAIDLLHEIAQHLRELRTSSYNTKASDTADGTLQPVEPPPFTTSSESYTPAVKKRRFWTNARI